MSYEIPVRCGEGVAAWLLEEFAHLDDPEKGRMKGFG
jgi:hypothetical protein